MNLKVLFVLLMYYGMLASVLLFGGEYFGDYSSNIEFNTSELQSDEIDVGGLFGTGISFGRFTAILGFGVGLPPDTPTWFALIFGMWETCMTLFSIGWLISSIWDG